MLRRVPRPPVRPPTVRPPVTGDVFEVGGLSRYMKARGFRDIEPSVERMEWVHEKNPEFRVVFEKGEPIASRSYVEQKVQQAAEQVAPVPGPEAAFRVTPRVAPPVRPQEIAGPLDIPEPRPAGYQIPHYTELSARWPGAKEMAERTKALGLEARAVYRKGRKKLSAAEFLRQMAEERGLVDPEKLYADPKAYRKAVKQAMKRLPPSAILQARRYSRLHALEQAELWKKRYLEDFAKTLERSLTEPVKKKPGITAKFWPIRKIMSQHPATRELFDQAARLERELRERKPRMLAKKVEAIFQRHHIDPSNPKDVELFTHVMHNRGRLTPFEMATIPRNIRAAAKEMDRLRYRIWVEAKKADPTIGHLEDWWPLDLVPRAKADLQAQLDDLVARYRVMQEAREVAPEEDIGNINVAIKALREQIQRLDQVGQQLEAAHQKAISQGGYFGHLSRQRVIDANNIPEWLVPRFNNLRDMMVNYIEGAYRKIYFDRLNPLVRTTLNKIEPTETGALYKNFVRDWVASQRGLLRKNDLAATLSNLSGQSIEKTRNWVDAAVDQMTAFQYAAKIGTSWVRFPIVNLTQNMLLVPIVGMRNLVRAAWKLGDKRAWQKAFQAGAITPEYTPIAETVQKLPRLFRILGIVPKWSENYNRALAYNAGLLRGRELGLKGKKLRDFALTVVERTHWAYTPAQMPLITRSRFGRLLWQFRSYTSFLAQYVDDLIKVKDWKGLAFVLGSLFAMAGTGVVPFGREAYQFLKHYMLSHHGVKLPEVNPLEAATRAVGLGPGIQIETSLEPWNVPTSWEMIAGPTFGPAIEAGISTLRGGERWREFKERLPQRIAPPLSRVFAGREARLEPSVEELAGRKIGERPFLERLYLRRSLESNRAEILRDLEDIYEAYKRGSLSHEEANRMIKEIKLKAKDLGIILTRKDFSTARSRATRKLLPETAKKYKERQKEIRKKIKETRRGIATPPFPRLEP
jgi:hypothetical protein